MSQIRGLVNFIGDIRNCKTDDEERQRVEEELAKIRASFAKTSVGSYAKKKYLWKIMYMYILGYAVDFGHMQCVDLIRSDNYSEKNVGYVGISLLLIEYSDMLRLTINTIKQDLNSRNEIFQCLALTCVANVGGPEFAESLVTDVLNLLVSQTSRNFVRKKAALCLLRLLRQYPDNVPSPQYAPQIVKLVEHRNVGVVTSVLSLLTGLAIYDPSNYGDIVKHAIKLLDQFVLQRECSKEYIYYRTPCPWLQIKLLRILQYYPPPDDKTLLTKLQDILERIVTKTEVTQSVNKNHSDHAILFEAINVIIHLNIHHENMLHDRAMHKLLHFINVKEGNIRYLGLDAMGRLAKISKTHKLIKRHLRTIQYSLDDDDMSIRKRALDLLYSICDEDNVVEILEHLLRYLNKAEYEMREDMVLKIAVLAEKFATDLQWYVNVALQLLTVAGDFVSEDVWHRVVQIVTNNESLQHYAAEKVYESLQNPPVHESMIKVAGYILGEFGHLLESTASGKEQFEILHKQFQSATPETKALLFSTYMKFVNLYPDDLKDTIIAIFAAHNSAVDPEIQQRAVEYEVMAKYENQDLITEVWEAMPDFPERESNLLKLIKQKEQGLTDKDPLKNESKNDDEREESAESHGSIEKEREKQEQEDKEGNDNDNDNNNDKTDDLLNVNDKEKVNQPVEEDLLSGLFDSATTTKTGGGGGLITLKPDPSLFVKAIGQLNALLYNDNVIRIGVKSQLEVENGIMKIYLCYSNPSNSNIDNVKIEVDSSSQGFDIQFSPNTPFSCLPKQEYQQKCKAMIIAPPTSLILKITFDAGGQSYALNLPFPVVPTKFFKPHILNDTQFKEQWQTSDKQSQQIFNLKQQFTSDSMRSTLSQTLNIGLIDGVDKNPNNVIGCAIWYFGKKKPDGSNLTMGILTRFELNSQKPQIRATVRSKHQMVSDAVLAVFQQVFESS